MQKKSHQKKVTTKNKDFTVIETGLVDLSK